MRIFALVLGLLNIAMSIDSPDQRWFALCSAVVGGALISQAVNG